MPSKSPIWLAVEKLTERLNALELNLNTPSKELNSEPQSTPLRDSFPEFPVPRDFVDIVDLTFNKSFKVRMEPLKDSPAFLFTIIVPPKYSKVTNGEDLRPKVILNADGVNGVRLWADKVFSNFDIDTQNLIIQDRPFVNKTL